MTIDSLTIEGKNGIQRIVLPNGVTMDNCGAIQERISAERDPAVNRVIIDLSQTTALFSSGLGLLIRIRKQCGEANAFVYLVNVSPSIKNLLESVHLDRIFPIFATDTEFEISQADIVEEKLFGGHIGFVFAAVREKGLYRINMSGHLTVSQDLSPLREFRADSSVTKYVLDLSGLDLMDSEGTTLFVNLLSKIKDAGGESRAYGANEIISDLIDLFSLTAMVTLFSDERSALQDIPSPR